MWVGSDYNTHPEYYIDCFGVRHGWVMTIALHPACFHFFCLAFTNLDYKSSFHLINKVTPNANGPFISNIYLGLPYTYSFNTMGGL